MEFTGRISRVLPMRSGTSQRTGNQWQALPFVFEYFEHEHDRYADSVLLETFDTNIIPYLKEGLEVKIGFGHKTREYEGKVYNELRIYKIESIKEATTSTDTTGAAAQPNHVNQGAQAVTANGQQAQASFEPTQGDDDLPF